jgi:hypothetical protein
MLPSSVHRLTTNAEAESGIIWDYPCTRLSANILYNDPYLSVDRINANLYGGIINADYHDNLSDPDAQLWLTALDIDFSKLTASTTPNSQEEMSGKFTGKVDLKITQINNNPLRLHGAGKVLIEDGDFWHIPIISDFLSFVGAARIIGKIIPRAELGVISKLNADLKFFDDRVNVPNLKTNGSVIAISANGNYWWETRQLDFRVTAEPLNSFFSKFVPKAIDPFDILLERRLKGTIEAPEWEEISAIRDLFRPQQSPEVKPKLPQTGN